MPVTTIFFDLGETPRGYLRDSCAVRLVGQQS